MIQYKQNAESKELSRACIESIPMPNAGWDVILRFNDNYASEIDGYADGDQHGGYEAFLNSAESSFEATGELAEDMHGLLAVVYQIYRRNRCSEFIDIDKYRPIVQAALGKASTLSK